MDGNRKRRQKGRKRQHSPEISASANSSETSQAVNNVCDSLNALNTTSNSSCSVNTSSSSAHSDDRTAQWARKSKHKKRGEWCRGGRVSYESERDSQHHRNQRGQNSHGNSSQVQDQQDSRFFRQRDAADAQSYNRGRKKDRHKSSDRDNSQRSSKSRYRGKRGGGYKAHASSSYQGGNRNNNYGRNRSGWWSGGYKGSGEPSSDTASGPSASASAASSSSSFDIPGFYYDPEKKKYFKIQSSSDVKEGDTGVVTKESIARKQAEIQRQKDLAALRACTTDRSSTLSQSVIKTHRKSYKSSLSSHLLNDYQRGEVDRFKLQRTWMLYTATKLRQMDTQHLFPSLTVSETPEHIQQMEVNKEHNQLLCLCSITKTMVQQIQLITLKEGVRTRPRELSLKIVPSSSSNTVIQSWNKIACMCWSDFPQYPDRKYILYTTMCHTGQATSLAFIRGLEEDNLDERHLFDVNLGARATWACAWNYHKQQLAVGTEKGCLVVDVKTRRLWQFKTSNSDALSLIFSKEDGGNTLYTGTRRGNILKHDMRSSSTYPVPGNVMSHQTSVHCLRLSPDENYLYASDFSGKIKQWDLRMQKTVQCYDGLFNQQCKLPFHVDETQSLLYAAGQDCYSKIWCLRTGKLLHSIPPPYEASLYSIPAVQFSSRWAGSPGNMGLILGAHRNFYLYGFQDDEG